MQPVTIALFYVAYFSSRLATARYKAGSNDTLPFSAPGCKVVCRGAMERGTRGREGMITTLDPDHLAD